MGHDFPQIFVTPMLPTGIYQTPFPIQVSLEMEIPNYPLPIIPLCLYISLYITMLPYEKTYPLLNPHSLPASGHIAMAVIKMT
jgi:hypothetical protein